MILTFWSLNSSQLTAVSTVALFLATVQLVRVARGQAISTSLALQSQFYDQFNSNSMRVIRKKIAKRVAEVTNDELLEVLDAIEHLATAVRRGGIDIRTVWASSLGDVIQFHILSSSDFILQQRQIDPTRFEDSLWYLRRASRLTKRRQIQARLAACAIRNPFDNSLRLNPVFSATELVEAELEIADEQDG